MNSDRRSFVGPILLAALSVAFFSNALLLGGVFSYRDLLLFHYPLRNYWVADLKAGILPFLNPAINGGQPILSNPNNSVFYPGNLLYFLFDFDSAWNFVLAGHSCWAGLGMYVLCRKLQCSRPACFSGAVVFAFAGPLLSTLTYYNLLITGSWIPWVLAGCMDVLLSERKHYARALLPLIFLLLAGEPTVLFVTAFLLIGLWWALRRSQPRSLRGYAFLGFKIAVPALLIFSVQLLPALMWLPHTLRGEGLDFRLAAAYWSFHPQRLIEFLSPGYYGDVMSSYSRDFWGGFLSDGGYPYVLKVYCGWLPLLFVLPALQRRAGRYSLILVLTCLLLSLGHRLPGYRWLFDYLPLYHVVRYPEKFLIFVQLGLALVVAVGSSRLATKGSTLLMMIGGSLLALLLVYLLVAGDHQSLNAQQLLMRKRSLYSAIVAGALSILVLGLVRLQRLKSISILLIPLVLTLDLLSNTFGLAATTPSGELHRPASIVSASANLRDDALYHRGVEDESAFFSGKLDPELLFRESLYPLFGLMWRISYGVAPDIDRMQWIQGEKRAAAIRASFPSERFVRLSRESGIGHIVSLAPMAGTALQLEARSDLQEKTIYLYRMIPPPRKFVHWKNGAGELTWDEEKPYSLRINVRCTEPGKIKVLRNALPGWKARVNGAAREIEVDSDGWMNVSVGPGVQRIALTYHPPGLYAGLGLSILGVIAATTISRKRKHTDISEPLITAGGR